MSQAPATDGTPAGVGSVKCASCGLVNFATQEACRRCGAALAPQPDAPDQRTGPTIDAEPAPRRARGFVRSALWIAGTTLTIVVLAFLSLLLTSDPLTHDQRQTVAEAIGVVGQTGFERETTALRYVVFYRSTDNWWNEHVGHQNAYAATNYPFAVVTLYPAFFRFSTDATERAAILLHEAQHVFGADERLALQRVWLDKQRLGWTAGRYGHTRVWKNTREWTSGAVPGLFQCGLDGQSDCVE